ncbi:MAG: polyprenol monophosphomannose synthase [Candidatus Cloacimonetes bacterium]|nr:polyprenol monophosphomannose synthase [Candidatus Cloacimonadota bacterium]
MKALVIIPTYNEADNVSAIIDEVLKQDKNLEVLIVDDNSPDGTSEIVEKKQLKRKKIHLLKRAGKMGLGSAYVAGFKYALEQNFDYIFEMDADFSHDPAVIPDMLEEIKDNDLVIGSRYLGGINVVNWPLRRLMLSFFAAHYVRFITGMPINDPTGGFKCFRRKVLETIDLDKILADGYSFQIEMNFRTWRSKFKIKEIPIVFTDRRSGQSKMSKKIVREAVLVVWKLQFLHLKKKL